MFAIKESVKIFNLKMDIVIWPCKKKSNAFKYNHFGLQGGKEQNEMSSLGHAFQCKRIGIT